jgi:hypothetical protein
MESVAMTPIISISPIMRDTTVSIEEPMERKNGYRKWRGKFKAAPKIIRVSWLLVKTNLKNHDHAASGRFSVRIKESEDRIQEEKGIEHRVKKSEVKGQRSEIRGQKTESRS